MDLENLFRQRLELWTAKGGLWEADNYASGENQPDGFYYQTWLDPHPLSMMFKIYERWANEKKLIWSGIHYWERLKSRSTYLSLGVLGAICHGHSTEGLEMTFTIFHPDGTIIEICNRDEVLEGNLIQNKTWIRQDGEWRETPGGRWQRIVPEPEK